jgi:hypothetical protein
MHGQSSTPALLASSETPPSVITPFDTHGGIATSYAIGDAAPTLSGKQLAHFYLAIREVDVTDASGRSQVVAQYDRPLIVDVLQYQGGSGATVGQATNNQRTYGQIRFVVDVAASQAVYTDNSTASLSFAYGRDTSSDARAGRSTRTTPAGRGLVAITNTQNFTVGASAAELVNVDFNLFESLSAGSGISPNDTSGGIAVRPTLFVAGNSNSGHITGTVVGSNGNGVSGAAVVAIGSSGNVGNTVATDASGGFDLHTLPADTYRIQIYNSYTNAAGAQFSAKGSSKRDVIFGPTITVGPGQSTSAGTITD